MVAFRGLVPSPEVRVRVSPGAPCASAAVEDPPFEMPFDRLATPGRLTLIDLS